jgi:beta-phosphoglucomutase-like phosphatase (HAD superfamily)
VEADVYIEDAPHNVEALRGDGNETIVFTQSYNRHLDGPRADTWEQAEELVIGYVAEKVGSYPLTLPLGPDSGRVARNLRQPGRPEDPVGP